MFLVYWFAKAGTVKRDIEKLNIWRWRLPPFVVFVYIVAALAIGGPLAGSITFRLWPSGAGSFADGILADIICFLGLGVAVWFARVSGFAFLLACIAAYWSRAIQEEKLMMRHFPKEYPEYREKTKTFLPFIF